MFEAGTSGGICAVVVQTVKRGMPSWRLERD